MIEAISAEFCVLSFDTGERSLYFLFLEPPTSTPCTHNNSTYFYTCSRYRIYSTRGYCKLLVIKLLTITHFIQWVLAFPHSKNFFLDNDNGEDDHNKEDIQEASNDTNSHNPHMCDSPSPWHCDHHYTFFGSE
jgi:hypothetical protein